MATLKFSVWLDEKEDLELAKWVEEEVEDMGCRRSAFIRLVLYREFKKEQKRGKHGMDRYMGRRNTR